MDARNHDRYLSAAHHRARRRTRPAIRNDVRLAKSHSFVGTLGVSEVSITLPEYLDFVRDEAGDDLVVVHHGGLSNLEQDIEAVQGAEGAGAELVLLSYPPNFYPESEQDLYDYTKALCDATNLAVILFPILLWDSAHASTPPTSRRD